MNTAICPWVLFIVMIVAAITVCYTDDNDLDTSGVATKTALKTARSVPFLGMRNQHVGYRCPSLQETAVNRRLQWQRRRRRYRYYSDPTDYRLRVYTRYSANEPVESRDDLFVRAYAENGDTWETWFYLPHTTAENTEAFLNGACADYYFSAKPLDVRRLKVRSFDTDENGWGPGWVEVHSAGNPQKYQCWYPCFQPARDDCFIDNGETKELECCVESCSGDIPDTGPSGVDVPDSNPWDD